MSVHSTKSTHPKQSNHGTPATIPPSPPAPGSLAEAAQQASALLSQIEASLPFDDPSAKDVKAATAANRVPTEAMAIAARVLEASPERFPDLEPAVARSAVEYEQSLGPIVQQLAQLQQRTSKTILNRRGQGAAQTLALYQVLKGLSRVSKSKATLVQQKQMEKLLKTSRKARATSVTKKELKVAAKKMKASKKAGVSAAKAAQANATAQVAAAEASAMSGSDAASASSAPAAPVNPPPATPSH
jgi:hypothetical protein